MKCKHAPDPFFNCGYTLVFYDYYPPNVYFICRDCLRLTKRKLSKYSRKLKDVKKCSSN